VTTNHQSNPETTDLLEVFRTRSELQKILWITGLWVFISICQSLYDYMVLLAADVPPDVATFWTNLLINALATIVGVIVAGALAGVAGMFLSLPVIAVFKIIFDRTENMQQWGVLLGDERPAKSPMQFPIFRKKDRTVQRKIAEQDDVDPPEKKH